MGTALSARNFLQAFRQNFQPMLSTADAFVDYMILVVHPCGEHGSHTGMSTIAALAAGTHRGSIDGAGYQKHVMDHADRYF